MDSADAIITPELCAWIGRETPLHKLEIIAPSDVRRYVDATGDANPLWLDDDFARSVGYQARILPPTLVGWVPFSFKEGPSGPIRIPPICAASYRFLPPTLTCAMPAPKPSGWSRSVWASNSRPEQKSPILRRGKGKPAWGSISRRKNRCSTPSSESCSAGFIPSPFSRIRNIPRSTRRIGIDARH